MPCDADDGLRAAEDDIGGGRLDLPGAAQKSSARPTDRIGHVERLGIGTSGDPSSPGDELGAQVG